MSVTVFDVFEEIQYQFCQLLRGGVEGNSVVFAQPAWGVFKFRSNLVVGESTETKESNSTLHIRPTETFLATHDNYLEGQGVRVDGKDYEIVGQTTGRNFDNGTIEHYTLTLQETNFATFGAYDES